MCHYWISAHLTRTKETGTTQPALPEQSLIRPNLIIAPIFTPSHKSTAAGATAVAPDCCALWVIISMVPFHG